MKRKFASIILLKQPDVEWFKLTGKVAQAYVLMESRIRSEKRGL